MFRINRLFNHRIVFVLIIIIIIGIYSFTYLNDFKIKNNNIIEDFNNNDNKYNDYSKDEENAYILAQKNTANIMFLKKEFDEVQQLKEKIRKLTTDVNKNTQGLTTIIEEQSKAANQIQENANKEFN